jgi:hypothetical protein
MILVTTGANDMHQKHFRSVLLKVVATFLLLTITSSANAWGSTGHRVVAEIAQRHLTPVAQEKYRAFSAGGLSQMSQTGPTNSVPIHVSISTSSFTSPL